MSATATDAGLCPISPDEMYPLPVLMTRAGLRRTAMREARRAGLKVIRRHGRVYVHGADFISYLRQHAAVESVAADAADAE